MNKKLILSIVIAVILIQSCKSPNKNSALNFINPPLKDIKVNEVAFDYLKNEHTICTTIKGSEITVPANSLVYENGSEVLEPVKIIFNEYETMGEIALSGIPMEYDTSGNTYNFKSGGMFNIQAKSKSGKKVLLKKDKNIEVELASYKNENFNFYKINEETGKWSFQNSVVKQTKIEKNIKEFPKPADSNDLVLDLNITKYNGSYDLESSMWKLDENISESKKNKIQNIKWNKYEVFPLDEDILLYKLKLTGPKHSVEVNVTPVLSENEMQNYRDIFIKKLKESQKDLASNYYKPKVKRQVYLKKFGTYNHDVYMGKGKRILASYKLNNKEKTDLQLFQFDLTRDAMITVNGNKLTFDPDSKNLLVALLPDKEVAVYEPSMYSTINSTEIGSEVEVNLKKLGVKINSAEDLQNLIVQYN